MIETAIEKLMDNSGFSGSVMVLSQDRRSFLTDNTESLKIGDTININSGTYDYSREFSNTFNSIGKYEIIDISEENSLYITVDRQIDEHSTFWSKDINFVYGYAEEVDSAIRINEHAYKPSTKPIYPLAYMMFPVELNNLHGSTFMSDVVIYLSVKRMGKSDSVKDSIENNYVNILYPFMSKIIDNIRTKLYVSYSDRLEYTITNLPKFRFISDENQKVIDNNLDVIKIHIKDLIVNIEC